MKLSTPLMYDGNPRNAADQIVQWEKAGLDTVWVAEAYGFDSPTLMGYLAAKTETVEIGSAILNIYSRTPALLAQTAAGPRQRLRRARDARASAPAARRSSRAGTACPTRSRWAAPARSSTSCAGRCKREKLENDGIIKLPLPEGQGTGLGKPLKMLTKPERDTIPIWIASLGMKNVAATAEYADGWLPHLFAPELADKVWGESLAAGAAKRPDRPGPAADRRRRHGRHRRGRQGHARLRAPDVRPLHRRHGRQGQELLQRPVRAVRLRGGGRADPGPLPRGQEGRGRGRRTGRPDGDVQPRRTGVLRQGAHRGLQGRRCHPPQRRPGHRGPGRRRSRSSRSGSADGRRNAGEARPVHRGARVVPPDRAHLHGARGRAPPQAVGGRRRRLPRGVAQGRRAGAALLRRRRGVRRRRGQRLPLQPGDGRGVGPRRRQRPRLHRAHRHHRPLPHRRWGPRSRSSAGCPAASAASSSPRSR